MSAGIQVSIGVAPVGDFAGWQQITGTVDELGAPGAYKVRLYAKFTGSLLQQTWSDEAGTYLFRRLADRSGDYFAVAHDHGANPVNAAVSDQLTLEPMP